jgi:hypothetical protein
MKALTDAKYRASGFSLERYAAQAAPARPKPVRVAVTGQTAPLSRSCEICMDAFLTVIWNGKIEAAWAINVLTAYISF